MQRMLIRGALIVMEGSDRVGKSTQALKLVERLQSELVSVELMKFPDRSTIIGQLISQYLKGEQELDDRVIHLLFSANRWEQNSRILRALSSGTTLIIDRYAYSGVAYSAAKNGMDFEWCRAPDVGLPKPDCVIYLTAPNDVIVNRNGFGDERYEMFDFQQKVKLNFNKLKEDNWKVICANKSIDELHEELVDIIKETIKNVKNSGETSISQLWTNSKKIE